MDGKHRYQPCDRTKLHNHRLNNENPLDVPNGKSKSMPYPYITAQASVVPLVSNKTLSSSTAIPQERESWIRSVKRTKINEGTEQKTQYLETMLRLQSWMRSVEKTKNNENTENTEHTTENAETIVHIPQQQKSSMDSSTFDRIRFADQQIPTTIENNNNNLNENTFHLISDVNNDDEISIIEEILFTNKVQFNTSNQIANGESNPLTDTDPSRWSGFLIDNCDEEKPSPVSPPPCPTLSLSPPPPPPPATSSIEEFIQKSQEDLNKRRLMLVNELDTADAEQRQELKRQKQLHKKLRKKKKRANTKPSKPSTINSDLVSTINTRNHQELSSDWIVEYDATPIDQISQLTDMIKKTSTTMTVENKVANINIILGKIKKQQVELRKLRQHVLSMLNEESKSNSTNPNEQSLSNDQDILMKFLNQPMTSGCWLCSGKTFTEVASQCNNTDEQ